MKPCLPAFCIEYGMQYFKFVSQYYLFYMKEIAIHQSEKVAFISDEDYERVSQRTWYLLKIKGKFYVVTSVKNAAGKRTNEYLHRFITNAPKNAVVEFRDGNPLNNTRDNLKVCSRRESQVAYDQLKAKAVSPFRGVSINRQGKRKWRAQIVENGGVHYLGSFLTEIEAALAYDREAAQRFGLSAQLNFPETSSSPVLPSDT